MSRSEYVKDAWNQDLCDALSFRGVLAQNLGFDNLNFSAAGSSNQMQFRLAENLFCSPTFLQYQQMYSSIQVLWGITSVLRGEFYFIDTNCRKNISYTVSNQLLSKCIISDHLDIDHEISLLAHKIRFWNDWFSVRNIKNWWYDTFNHHDYTSVKNCEHDYPTLIDNYKKCAGPDWPTWGPNVHVEFDRCDQTVKDEILDCSKWEFYHLFPKLSRFIWHDLKPRDLMSQLARHHGFGGDGDTYHASDWLNDCERIEFLLDKKLINPFTKHPTHNAHRSIASWLEPYLSTVE